MGSEMEKTELEKMLEQKIAESNAADGGAFLDTDTPSADSDSDGTAASNTAMEELAAKIEEQKAQNEQLKDQLLRVRADFDNYRKRMLREIDQVRKTASSNLIRALLPALDNLERALAHATAEEGFVEGVGMVYKQFQEVLAGEGLEPIPSLHEAFDPNIHDALATVPSEHVEEGRIVEEYERGYRLRDSILRPAKVIVSSGSPVGANDSEEENSAGDESPADGKYSKD